jgi:hypothetical protein
LVKFIDTEYNKLLKARERVKYWDEKRAEEYARMYTEQSRPQTSNLDTNSNQNVSSRVATNQSAETSKTTNFIPDTNYYDEVYSSNVTGRENMNGTNNSKN